MGFRPEDSGLGLWEFRHSSFDVQQFYHVPQRFDEALNPKP